MEKPNILNTLNVLQKIEMGENALVLFYFGDTPNWNQNDFSFKIGESLDHYEVVEINFDLEYSDKVNLYWKIHRYVGETSFITVENNSMNFWRGEITDYEEQWNYFDDLDDEILILNYKKYNVQKTAEDWRNDYKKLEKCYYSLYKKKIIQLTNLREEIQSDLRNKIEKRLEKEFISKKVYKHSDTLTREEVDKLIALAFNSNEIRIDLLAEFLYDINE